MSNSTFLQNFANTNWKNILTWLEDKHKTISPNASNIYNSCDIRYSGFKIANVDCNLFPAGFKNISEDGVARSIEKLKKFINTKKQNNILKNEAKNVIIVSESHTRNIPYLHGVLKLSNIFEQAGCVVRLATFDLKKFKVKFGGQVIEVHKLLQKDGKLILECEGYKNQQTNDLVAKASDGEVIFETCPETGKPIAIIKNGKLPFVADFIVINNDMTAGRPAVLQGADISTFPAVDLGWHSRKKAGHFTKYQQIVEQFATNFNIDPWLFNANFTTCEGVDIKEGTGLENLANSVEQITKLTAEKYKQYGISAEAKTYIKANAGTYGMGVMMLNNAEEVMSLNKHARAKLDSIKAGVKNTSFLVQEGVPSIVNIENSPAELVAYGFNLTPCDFFYRYHPDKDTNNSLNAPGAKFVNLGNFVSMFTENSSEAANLKLTFISSSLAFLACGLE